jgi:flagellar motor switch protein FliM
MVTIMVVTLVVKKNTQIIFKIIDNLCGGVGEAFKCH